MPVSTPAVRNHAPLPGHFSQLGNANKCYELDIRLTQLISQNGRLDVPVFYKFMVTWPFTYMCLSPQGLLLRIWITQQHSTFPSTLIRRYHPKMFLHATTGKIKRVESTSSLSMNSMCNIELGITRKWLAISNRVSWNISSCLDF